MPAPMARPTRRPLRSPMPNRAAPRRGSAAAARAATSPAARVWPGSVRRLVTAFALVVGLASPAAAHCLPVHVTLSSGGSTWDFADRGSVVNGTDGAYDGLYRFF